jgi:hypothetical protein
MENLTNSLDNVMKRLESQEKAHKELMEIIKKIEEEKNLKVNNNENCKIKIK